MDAQSNMTSLSVGLLIKDLLSTDEGVMAVANKVFPVISEAGAKLPYICYRRGANDDRGVKNLSGADTTTVEVLCYAATYEQSILMAEAVRKAADGVQYRYDDAESGQSLVARSIQMTDAEEGWQDDAYIQSLIFTVKVNNS